MDTCATGKTCYDKRGAQEACNNRTGSSRRRSKRRSGGAQGRGVKFLRVYQCELCNYWHLTHQEMKGGRS